MLRLLLIIQVVFLCIECKTLPTYIKTCSDKDPNEFEKCALKSARDAFPTLIKGDEKFNLQSLSPLRIPLLEFDSNGLKLTLRNVVISGFNTTDITKIKYDKNAHKVSAEIFSKHIHLVADYVASGKILVLPIVGDGQGFLDFVNLKYFYTFDLNVVKNKAGKEVIKTANPVLNLEYGGVTFKLENLFNGDKVLGPELNRFMNENWKEVILEFEHFIKAPLIKIANDFIHRLVNNQLYETIFSKE